MDYNALRRNYTPVNLEQPKQERKKPGGFAGFLTGALPIIGGAVGSVGGTLIGGPVGTIAGGAAGSGFGEFLRQQLSGEQADLGSVGRETLLGAIPGGLALKGARAASKTARAAENTTEGAMLARRSLPDKVKSAGTQTSQEGFGLTVGQNAGRGKVLTPEAADKSYAFITQGSQKYGGIRPGKPIDQARDAQNVFNNVTKSLDETLTKINRPVSPQEAASVTASAAAKVADNPSVTGTTKTLEKFTKKIQSANGDLAQLEKIRREADDVAFTSTGAGKTSAAAQAHAVRDAIDEFITPLSPDYKAIKGDYTAARDALDATSKANKGAKGFKVPFVDVEVGKQSISGAKNKAAAKASGVSGEQKSGAFRPFVKPALQQTGTRVASSALFGTPFVGTGKEEEQITEPGQLTEEQQVQLSALEQPAEMTEVPNQSAELFNKAMQALEAGDIKAYGVLADAAEKAAAFEKAGTSTQKPLSAEAARTVSNAQAGLEAIDLLRGAEQTNPNARSLSAVSGTFDPFGFVSNALGTGEYENARQQAIDIIARLRTGAAITKDEESRFLRMLPQAGDADSVAQQKLGLLSRQFQRVANRSANTSDLDPSEALAG